MDGSLIRRNVVIYLNEQCPIIAVHFIYHTVAELEKWKCISFGQCQTHETDNCMERRDGNNGKPMSVLSGGNKEFIW